MYRAHITFCRHTFFIEAEYACWWELLLKEKSSESLTKTRQWMTVELLDTVALRTQETLRRRKIKTIPLHRPNKEMKLAGGYLQNHKEEENRIMRSRTAFPRFGYLAAGVLKCSQKPWNRSPSPSSRRILTWPCFCDNYQRKLKEQAAQRA